MAASPDAAATQNIREVTEMVASRKLYSAGFITDIEADKVPPGLSEDVIRLISAKKDEPEWLLNFRLKAYRRWLTMTEPEWANVDYQKVDYQSISYYSQPKSMKDGPKTLDEVDPKLLETYRKLGIPLREQEMLAGVQNVGVGRHHVQEKAGRGRRDLLPAVGSGEDPSGAGQEVSRLGSAVRRQLLRSAEHRRVHRRLVRLHPEGHPLPDGTVDLFPHKRAQ